MATLFIGYNRGDTFATTGSSTTGKEIELAVDDAAGITPRELIASLERVTEAFSESNAFTE